MHLGVLLLDPLLVPDVERCIERWFGSLIAPVLTCWRPIFSNSVVHPTGGKRCLSDQDERLLDAGASVPAPLDGSRLRGGLLRVEVPRTSVLVRKLPAYAHHTRARMGSRSGLHSASLVARSALASACGIALGVPPKGCGTICHPRGRS